MLSPSDCRSDSEPRRALRSPHLRQRWPVPPKPAIGGHVPSHRVRARARFSHEQMMWGCMVSAGREHERAKQMWPRLAVLSLLSWLVLGGAHSGAATPLPAQLTDLWPVELAFREAVQLWADERFEALWERGLRASRYRVPREVFVRGMRHRVVTPTCCWGQLRDVRVHPRTEGEALVEAQVGVDVKTLGTTVMRSMIVYLRREEGVWRVALEDFLTKPEDGLPGGLPGLGWLR
jgi:hypothetical protein